MTNDFGITDELVAHVESSESLSLVPYRDPVGFPTIGYGRRISDMTHPLVTAGEALDMLRDDLRAARDQLLALSPSLVNASQRRVAALTSFCFNVGAGHYAGSTLRKCVAAADWPAAASEIERWVYGHDGNGQVVTLPGLVIRRATEAGWLLNG